jgi:hypothetical protein
MPSWGNTGEVQHAQDMDSNGYKLKVTHSSGSNPAIEAENDSGNALLTKGDVELAPTGPLSPFTVNLSNATDGGVTLNVYGNANIQNNLEVDNVLKVGARIEDAGGNDIIKHDGTDVVISQTNQLTDVMSNLKVRGDAEFMSRLDVSANGIRTEGVVADENGDQMIGVQSNETRISTSARTTRIMGLLQLEDAIVGKEGSLGDTSSGGAVLKVTNASTTAGSSAVRGEGPIALEAEGRIRANNNEVVLDNRDDLTAGSGIVFNSTGHGSGPSIDFYIQGTLEGYLDSTGWNT